MHQIIKSETGSQTSPGTPENIGEKPYVVFWNNIPAPYMVERFNALVARGNLDFEAWFSDKIHSERSWSVDEDTWAFRYRYLKSLPFSRNKLKRTPYFTPRRPDLMICLHSEPSFVVGWAAARMLRIPIAFRYLVTFDTWITRKWWKERLKQFMFRRVEATLSPGEQSAAQARQYGVPPARSLILPQAVNVLLFQMASALDDVERNRRRVALGLEGTTFVYVGRLRWGKGLDCLIDAFAALQLETDTQTSLLFVGDGAEEGRLRDQCEKRSVENVIFTGFVQRTDLPFYYGVADVFVFPTLGDPYGQAVNEAMACSLPIIATRAAGDIAARVDHGVNGLLVTPGDSRELQEAMKALTDDANRRQGMGKRSASKIEGQTPEQWAATFEQHVGRILSMPRARARKWKPRRFFKRWRRPADEPKCL